MYYRKRSIVIFKITYFSKIKYLKYISLRFDIYNDTIFFTTFKKPQKMKEKQTECFLEYSDDQTIAYIF